MPDDCNAAEDLDEDAIKRDPLDAGMDPPERWSQAGRFGTTAAEQHRGEDLAHRLAQEEPDVQPVRPDAPLDDGVDERAARDDPPESMAPDDSIGAGPSPAARRGQSADQAR